MTKVCTINKLQIEVAQILSKIRCPAIEEELMSKCFLLILLRKTCN